MDQTGLEHIEISLPVAEIIGMHYRIEPQRKGLLWLTVQGCNPSCWESSRSRLHLELSLYTYTV